MQEMDLIDDDQPDELGVGALPRLPGDNIPFLGGTHDDLGGIDLFFVQLVIPSQLGYSYTIRTQSLEKQFSQISLLLQAGTPERW